MATLCRHAWIGLFALASLTAFAQDTSVHVNYRTVAVPARKAIADIARASNVDLGVAAPLDSQPLILRLEDVPLREAMDRIAAVLHGSWIQNKTAYTLQRTDDIVGSLRDQVFQERFNTIQAWRTSTLSHGPQAPLDAAMAEGILRKQKEEQAAAEKEMNAPEPSAPQKELTAEELKAEQARQEAEQAENSRERSLTARGRLEYRVLEAIDPTVLASAPAGRQLVFSTKPKPLQYQLQMSDEDFQTMMNEQNIWTAADMRVNPESYDTDGSFDSRPRHEIDPSSARLIALVEIDATGGPQGVEIYLLDEKGRQLVDNNGSSGIESYTRSYDASDETDFTKWKLPTITLSPLAREMVSLSMTQDGTAADQTRGASPELRAFLLDATNHDPLSLHVSEVLLGCAEAKNWNLVASPSDDAMFTNYDRADKISGTDMLNTFANSFDISVTLDGTWLTIHPKHPLLAEAMQSDRESLATMLKAVDEQGYISIDTMAAFAAANHEEVDLSLATQYISLCHLGTYTANEMAVQSLRLYGLLSDQQRSALLQGSQLSTEDFTPEQAEALQAVLQQPGSMISGDANGFSDSSMMMMGMDDGIDTPTPIWSSYTQPKQEQQSAPSGQDEMVDFMSSPLVWNYSEYIDRIPGPSIYLSLAVGEGDEICENVIPKEADTENKDNNDFYIARRHSSGLVWGSPQGVASQIASPQGDTITYASCPIGAIQIQIGVAHRFTSLLDLCEHRKGMTAFGSVDRLPARVRKAIEERKKEIRDRERYTEDPNDAPSPEPVTGPPPPLAGK